MGGLFDPKFRKQVRDSIRSNPILKREVELNRYISRCFDTHKGWWEDRDVHGPLDEYCIECGVNRIHFQRGNRARESFMTCEEIKNENERR